jgi:hypothetical protein
MISIRAVFFLKGLLAQRLGLRGDGGLLTLFM